MCSDVFTIDDIDIFACCGVVKSAKMNIYLRAIKISQPAKVNCDIECGNLPLAFPARFERAAFRLGVLRNDFYQGLIYVEYVIKSLYICEFRALCFTVRIILVPIISSHIIVFC